MSPPRRSCERRADRIAVKACASEPGLDQSACYRDLFRSLRDRLCAAATLTPGSYAPAARRGESGCVETRLKVAVVEPNIYTGPKTREVEAKQIEDIPLVAYEATTKRDPNGRWQVYHLPTRMGVQRFQNERSALRVLCEVARSSTRRDWSFTDADSEADVARILGIWQKALAKVRR